MMQALDPLREFTYPSILLQLVLAMLFGGVFGLEGDSAENVITRYGAVMYIEPESAMVL